jgi:anti-sigma regulatory factor (Ser/Thr protein kinase)
LNKKSVPLEPDPRSVKVARQWVSDILDMLGRDDLVDAAELGVSELVTNAILHAEPPITVRVRGTRDHPRVEVHDHSQHPPEVNVEMAEDDFLMSTVGRGLGIVALYSSTWGADMSPDGKTVWFEPAKEPRLGDMLSGKVFDFSEVVDERIAISAPASEELITVRLIGMPVQLFARYRTRYDELRRELQLLALGHGDDYPVAREVADIAVQVEQERRQADGVSELDQAIAEGRETADLTYQVPTSAPESMRRLLEALERADEFCRDQRLLALAATPEQRALQRWYLGEFVRQGKGEAPEPWHGSAQDS